MRIEAARVHRLVPRDAVAVDDLVGYGHLGLLEARERFDPRRGVHFEVFARHRIRGAMFDGLRALGHLTRRAWEQVRQQAIAHDVVGEPTPPPPPGAGAREVDAQAVVSSITALATAFLVQSAAIATAAANPEMLTGRERDLARMRAALAQLGPDDRETLTAFYDLGEQGDSAAALARRRSVNRSTVSRHHRQALDRLRALMQAPEQPP